MLDYELPLFRPPSEADSLILQITVGCSHNKCTFCSMYRGKRFRAKSLDEVRSDIGEASRLAGPGVARVFLADGDALCLSMERLTGTLDELSQAFPRLRRVGSYANARDVLRKSPGELSELRRRRLAILYLGLESGDDETLTAVEKGATAAEVVEAVRRANAAGIATSVMVLVGVAGRERSLVHARRSAEALNLMEPTYTALLTYTPTPGSPLQEKMERGEFELPGPVETLVEIRELLLALECRTHFACTHASNYVPVRGRLPGAKGDLLALLDAAIAGRIPLRPESARGL